MRANSLLETTGILTEVNYTKKINLSASSVTQNAGNRRLQKLTPRGWLNMSQSNAGQSVPNILSPLRKFEEDVKGRLVSGKGLHTTIGWALFLFFTIDALMNVRGNRSITSALMSGLSPLSQSPNLSPGAIEVLTICLQVVGLGVGAVFLFNSPWKIWLPVVVRKSLPFVWVKTILGSTAFDASPVEIFKANSAAIIKDVLSFCAAVFLLGPLAKPMVFITGWNAALSSIIVLVLAYGVTLLVGAVAETVLVDRASTIGFGIGCIAPILIGASSLGAYFGSAMTPSGYGYFQYHELIVFVVAIIGLILTRIPSINTEDVVYLNLEAGDLKVVQPLPDAASSGIYLPFRFKVVPHGALKLALLSSEVKNPQWYKVHTMNDPHDLTAGIWTILDLSALELSVGQGETGGAFEVVSEGDAGLFRCKLKLTLTTLTAESLAALSHEHGAIIPLQDLARFKDQFAFRKGHEIGASLAPEIKREIDGRLDNLVLASDDSPIARIGSVSSLKSMHQALQIAASKAKSKMDAATTDFQRVYSNSIMPQRAEDLSDKGADILERLDSAKLEFDVEYEKVSNVDHVVVKALSNLNQHMNQEVQKIVNEMIAGEKRVSESTASESRSRPKILNILELIKIKVISTVVEPTAEFLNLDEKLIGILSDVTTKFEAAGGSIREIAKNNKEVDVATLLRILEGKHGRAAGRYLLEPPSRAAERVIGSASFQKMTPAITKVTDIDVEPGQKKSDDHGSALRPNEKAAPKDVESPLNPFFD